MSKEEIIAILRQLQANFDQEDCIPFAAEAIEQIDRILKAESRHEPVNK